MAGVKTLIFGATGQQGGATAAALLRLKAKGAPVDQVFGVTRDPASAASVKFAEAHPGLNLVKGDFNSVESVASVIKETGATTVFFMTDFWSAAGMSRAKETQQGKNVVDGIKQCLDQLEFVVYTSTANADKVPEKVANFRAKADVETYMEAHLPKEKWAVLRPVQFYENLDDARNWNALTKGQVKFVTNEKTATKFVSTVDIGKAAAALFLSPFPENYAGRKLDLAVGTHTGTELAAALTEVSGVECTYAEALWRPLMWLIMGDLYHMVAWIEEEGYNNLDTKDFLELVPDAMDAAAWFKYKGQWSSPAGEAFAPAAAA